MVTDECGAAVRRRSLALLDRVGQTLVEPRDPETVRRAAEWQRDHERRQAEDRATEAARAEPALPADVKAPNPVASVRGGYGNTVVTYQVLEETMRTFAKNERSALANRLQPYLGAVVDKMSETFASARTKTSWRFEESERRIAELEERIARLEGRTDG